MCGRSESGWLCGRSEAGPGGEKESHVSRGNVSVFLRVNGRAPSGNAILRRRGDEEGAVTDQKLAGRESGRCRLRVEGRVQGVGFRAWTAWTARRLGLAGWVRNLPDGAVELEAEGTGESVARMREAVGRGPELARVTRVAELEPGALPLPFPFEVRYR